LRWASLAWADLFDADLTNANLAGADLTGADLNRAKGILSFGPIGPRGRVAYAVRHTRGVMVQYVSFWGRLDEWETGHLWPYACPPRDSASGMTYAVAFIRAHAQARQWKIADDKEKRYFPADFQDSSR
jgi:hypothetical protein